MLRKLLIISLVASFLLLIGAALFITWGYFYITRDLPKISSLEDYQPQIASIVYARDGSPIGEFFKERRYLAKLEEVPLHVRNAFLAAEDASFYQHAGIDPVSILRAVVRNIQEGESKQGGSTITQQVVKNLLLTPEKKIRRKIKEAILSYQLEKRLTKNEILEIYLNQIFFGNTAYGIRAAARVYFRKDLSDLSLAEGAILAGLPKAPSKYSPILSAERAKRRQRYVLKQMVKAGFITTEEEEAAAKERIKVYPASAQNIFHAPFYVSEVRRLLSERWRSLDVDADGLQIYTALDIEADRLATLNLRKGLREVDKRRGWRGPLGMIPGADVEKYRSQYSVPIAEELEEETAYPALVTHVSATRGIAKVTVGTLEGEINLRDASWARRQVSRDEHVIAVRPEQVVQVGDVVEVALKRVTGRSENGAGHSDAESSAVVWEMSLDQAPEIEGAMVLLDPFTGEVHALGGGYSYQRSVFNRATQSLRQPGSSFKPIVYLAAVDGFHYTPSTIVYDMPRTFRVGDEFWTPGNFDGKYLGGITLRTALEKSRNLVSADIVSRIGVNAVIQYARKLGIESPLGKNLSLALGSSEVTLLELVRAYGVFAAKGVLFDTTFITKILNRHGQVLFDSEAERLSSARQVISEQNAFIMANMMKGVVEHGTGYRVKELGRPVAGKTGTSNEEMDTWFIGYTPEWVCGVWAGFDLKKRIGEKETGGRVAAPIFLYFMRDFLQYKDTQNYERLLEVTKTEAERLGIQYTPPEQVEPLDFSVPEGVDPYWVDKATGILAEQGSPGAILEYFIRGTEPSESAVQEETTNSYLESPGL